MNATPDIQTLRDTIPKHCFVASNFRSFLYIVRDLTSIAIVLFLGMLIPALESFTVRLILWSVYGLIQGMLFTGLWILAHECGHEALFAPRWLNNVAGFPLHSMLLVPYFSWKYSHARHHRYTNHMEKDTVFVPRRKDESNTTTRFLEMLHLSEDAPLANFLNLLGHQLFGWPAYLFFNASAGEQSLVNSTRSQSKHQSHFEMGDLFSSREHPYVVLSDGGIITMLLIIGYIGRSIGLGTVLLLYGLPYMWVNHWIVAITFMHHTHERAAHYGGSEWTYQLGALATVDRDFGFIGRHIFHHIIEHHVIHHLFPRIPFYHAEEATEHISGLLGQQYLRETSPFWRELWRTFLKCQYVVKPDKTREIFTWASFGGAK